MSESQLKPVGIVATARPTNYPPKSRRATPSVLATIWSLLLEWSQRQRERQQLSRMSSRDFGDLAIPSNLIRGEARRWPWQKPLSHWTAIRAGRTRSDYR